MKSIFKDLVVDFKAKHPFLIYSEEKDKITKIKDWLRSSRSKLEIGHIDDAIKDAGLACEGILQIIGRTQKIEDDQLEYGRLLDRLASYIEINYGEELLNDLEFIRKWRNIAAHPHMEKPDASIATQVVHRAELFFKLFELKIKDVIPSL